MPLLASACGGGGGNGTAGLPTPTSTPLPSPVPTGVAPASVTVLASPAVLALGTAGTVTLTAVAKDANGNTITSGAYPVALKVSVSDPANFTLSVPAFIAPGQSITATYSGKAAAAELATFSVTGGSLSAAAVIPAVVGVGPATVLAYSGTLTQAIVTNIVNTPPPAPSATPQTSSSATFTYTAAQAVTVVATTAPSVDQHTVETDTLAGNGPVTTVTSDLIFTAPSGAGNIVASSYAWTNAVSANDETATTDTTTYGAQNGIIGIVPETAGATWSNSAAKTELEANADGRTTSLVTNANGTYALTLTGAPPASGTQLQTIGENADGSGTLVEPCGYIGGSGYCALDTGTGNQTWAFQTPASGSQVVNYSYADSYVNSSGVTVPVSGKSTSTVQLWYALPPALWSDTSTVVGTVTVPSSCNLPAAAGTTATQVNRAVAVLDTIVGYTETTATSTYNVPGYGVLCTSSTDTLTTFYDYSGANDTYPYFVGKPIVTTTTTETLGITAASLTVLAAQRRAASLQAAAVRPSLTGFTHLVAKARRALILRAFTTRSAVRY